MIYNKNGGIAQLEERALCKREAPGSKPGTSIVIININILLYICWISLEVRTPRCGRGDPGSNPGSSKIILLSYDIIYIIYNKKGQGSIRGRGIHYTLFYSLLYI